LTLVLTKELKAIKERVIKSGFDFIDFWARDFNWHSGKPFTYYWQHALFFNLTLKGLESLPSKSVIRA
jgi:hypothetical protein